jgi:drug/metabolite transporter (DMT)-like permease
VSTPSRAKVIAAFAAVYVIWGSTYLAIRICAASMPPFLMAGTRFLLAGAVLYAIARLRGAERPRTGEWMRSAVVGGLLVVGGNGLVVWSAPRLPSSTVALMIAMAPLWFTLLAWILRGPPRAGSPASRSGWPGSQCSSAWAARAAARWTPARRSRS